MSQVLPLLMWTVLVGELLLGVSLVEKAGTLMEQGFRQDYAMLVCGRYRALEANVRAAVATWRKMGCAGEEGAELEIENFLAEWRERYEGFDPDACAEEGPLRVRIVRERNPDLDADYPNWVVKYE